MLPQLGWLALFLLSASALLSPVRAQSCDPLSIHQAWPSALLTSVFVGDGRVWVTEGHLGTVASYSLDGAMHSRWKLPGSSPYTPGIATGPNGDVYVCEIV